LESNVFLNSFVNIPRKTHMNKLLTITFIFSLTINIVQAQHYEHFTSWKRVLVQKKLSDNWEVSADVHWRRQSDFAGSGLNPLAEPLMEGYRITTTYRVKEMVFSFAPFLSHSYPLYSNSKDLSRPIRWEIRPAFNAEWTKKLSDKWTFRSRLGYEYRIFKRTDDIWGDEQGRARLRLQLRYALNKKNTLVMSEEPLYNVSPNVPANSFSQNQIYFGLNHTFTPHFAFETGYMWNHRQRASLVEFDEENVLQTHFIFRL
jgi:Protein of unknown function (DUF2490)